MTDTQLFSFEWWQIFLGGISTLAIFSFLYRENPFYRLFEHLFIGIATSVGIVSAVRNFLWPQVIKPLFGYDRIVFPDGTYSEPYNEMNLLFLLPIAFGMLYYFILTKRLAWLAQITIGFSLGVGGGLAFQGTFNDMLPQLYDSFRPLWVPGSGSETFANIVIFFTLVTSLVYFFFTFQRKPGGLMDRTAASGRWMMMICFGAFFGSTIMARMALLVERLDFLINSWWPTLFG